MRRDPYPGARLDVLSSPPQSQANTTAALRLGVKLASDQPERFVRDDLFELVLGRSRAGMNAARASAETWFLQWRRKL